MQALRIAATGMAAQETNVEVISNNIANMRTTGFKKYRAEFQDLLYQSLRREGTSTSTAGTMVPTGVQVGMGVQTAATSRIMSQGSVSITEKELDVAIRGEGFFEIELPDGRTAYTRDGTFERDAEGRIVTVDGFVVQPEMTIPDEARSVTINNEGTVEIILEDDANPVELGRLTLTRFVNKGGLLPIGENLFVETAASGNPQVGNAADEGFGSLLQGYLEESNVDAVTEISDLIAAQRAYEMNSRVISAADEMMASVSNLR
ncbi:MAG: flagellar basal-body rod protein FlgG [Hyphomicrobiales bacterium]|nr:flagellar basal-body rod protein FlgG [Hyphomicrobiales bacterium]